MSKKNMFFGSVLLLLISPILSSCGSTAPFTERNTALESIDLAESVEAEKYSPIEFENAISKYEEGEDLIVEERKSKQNDKARARYLEADRQAQLAYTNSVGPYIKEFINKTDEEIEKARGIKTDIALPEAFEEATLKNDEARNAFNNQNYEQAKSSSLEAYDTIHQAYNETIELREEAAGYDQEYANLLFELEDNKAKAAIPNEYDDTVENYEYVRSHFDEGYYMESIELYQDGILDGEDLLALIEEKRLLAIEELSDAEDSIEEAKMKVDAADLE